jgi:DNA-binding XRE family transcriptional regulator
LEGGLPVRVVRTWKRDGTRREIPGEVAVDVLCRHALDADLRRQGAEAIRQRLTHGEVVETPTANYVNALAAGPTSEGTRTNQIPSLAGRVKQLREVAGLSKPALATAAGLSISVVIQIERGTTAHPRVSTVAALARALGVTVDALSSGGTAEATEQATSKGKAAGEDKVAPKRSRRKGG